MIYHVELFSCAVPLVDSKLQPPKPCDSSSFAATGVFDLPDGALAKPLIELPNVWFNPADAAKTVFCNTNGATISNTFSLTKYAALTGQALANAEGEDDPEVKKDGDGNSSEGSKAAKNPEGQKAIQVYVLTEDPLSTPPKKVSVQDALKEASSMITLQLVADGEEKDAAVTTKASAKDHSIRANQLLRQCNNQASMKWEDVKMAMVKQAMESVLVAPSLELWSGPQTKLLDLTLPFETYCSQIWTSKPESTGKLIVYYGLSKNYDKKTAQQVYNSKSFLLKVYHLKSDKTPVASMRVKEVVSPGEKGIELWSDVASWTLKTFRKKINTMSALESKHTFCLADGSPMPDSTTLPAYLELVTDLAPINEDVPSISLRFKEVDTNPSSWHGGAAAKTAVDALKVNPKIAEGDIPGSLVTVDNTAFLDKSKLDLNSAATAALAAATMGQEPLSVASKLDELQWALIMQNCHVLHGWYLDKQTNRVKMAPKPAFTLRPDLNIEVLEDTTETDTSPTKISTEMANATKQQGKINANNQHHRKEQNTNAQKKNGTISPETGKGSAPSTETPSTQTGKEKTQGGGTSSSTSVPRQPLWTKPNAIPTFRVNDGSKIEIVTVEDEQRHSMVRNSFEKSSLEVGVSGGYAGVGVGVTGGFSSDSQKGNSKEDKATTTTMVGKYMLPRVTLTLRPEDLRPTPELVRHINMIKKEKNPLQVRRFYERFGYFFAQEVTLGGVLLSTKVVDGTEHAETTKSKEAFKTAIGLSVTTPIEIGVSAKYEKITGNDKADVDGNRHVNDRVAFEATGGNTLLAGNPAQWCVSVGDHMSWRVIERSELKPIVDAIDESSPERFGDIFEWFSNTYPDLLGANIEIPRSMQLFAQARFNAVDENNKAQYLVHQVDKQITTEIANLSPEKFQGPRMAAYEKGWDIRDGIWVITPRNPKLLLDGSSVTIRASHDWSDNRFLTMLRTSGDFYVPCISTSGHDPIWTIRRAPDDKKPLPATPSREPLRYNDTFCLTFDFWKNPRGYRDFFNDDRGYRRRSYPVATNNRLVLGNEIGGVKKLPKSMLIMADEAVKPGHSVRIVKIDNAEVQVALATFKMDILASDGTDEDYDILTKDPAAIDALNQVAKQDVKTANKPVPQT
ncbi:hypothetical protein PG984_016367 [Apiospora sp. TS-2023a]